MYTEVKIMTKQNNISFHCRCKTEKERNAIKEELRIRAAINKMTNAKYLIALFDKTERELK
jgi:hypothetical protein